MALFPLTRRACKLVWDGTQDPLALLNPCEVKAAELYVSLARKPVLHPGTRDRNTRVSFGRLFREHFGFDLTVQMKRALFDNPAWMAYVHSLQHAVQTTVLQRLEAGAMDAVADYLWSRQAAKTDGDYKEVRLGAADYLDRVGATKKVSDAQPPTGVTIVLKLAGEVSHAQVLRQLPAIDADLVGETDG
jgi:hypothetical protein